MRENKQRVNAFREKALWRRKKEEGSATAVSWFSTTDYKLLSVCQLAEWPPSQEMKWGTGAAEGDGDDSVHKGRHGDCDRHTRVGMLTRWSLVDRGSRV